MFAKRPVVRLAHPAPGNVKIAVNTASAIRYVASRAFPAKKNARGNVNITSAPSDVTRSVSDRDATNLAKKLHHVALVLFVKD